MRFQDSICINGSKVTVGIKIRDGRNDRPTHGQAINNMSLKLFQSWEHNKTMITALFYQSNSNCLFECVCYSKMNHDYNTFF